MLLYGSENWCCDPVCHFKCLLLNPWRTQRELDVPQVRADPKSVGKDIVEKVQEM